ncbi:hypothetical protein GBA52_004132 [Prunus armeniaca]|nr:hypothetical protein GBA52_004132 [Prunus armeniaca]
MSTAAHLLGQEAPPPKLSLDLHRKKESPGKSCLGSSPKIEAEEQSEPYSVSDVSAFVKKGKGQTKHSSQTTDPKNNSKAKPQQEQKLLTLEKLLNKAVPGQTSQPRKRDTKFQLGQSTLGRHPRRQASDPN